MERAEFLLAKGVAERRRVEIEAREEKGEGGEREKRRGMVDVGAGKRCG